MRAVLSRRGPTGVLVCSLVTLAAACGSSAHGQGGAPSTSTPAVPTTTATTAPPTTAPPTTVAPPTTTTVRPPDPRATPDAASGALIRAWERGARATAATVASKAAISALFAVPYKGQPLNDRGCGAAGGPNPVECTWGPYAGGAQTSAVYDITVLPIGSAWYVSAVTVLG